MFLKLMGKKREKKKEKQPRKNETEANIFPRVRAHNEGVKLRKWQKTTDGKKGAKKNSFTG